MNFAELKMRVYHANCGFGKKGSQTRISLNRFLFAQFLILQYFFSAFASLSLDVLMIANS